MQVGIFYKQLELWWTQCGRHLAIKVLLVHGTRVSKLLYASLHRPEPQKVNIFIFYNNVG